MLRLLLSRRLHRLAPLLLCLPGAEGSAQPAAATPSVPLAAVPELVGAGVVSAALSEFAPSLTPDGRTLRWRGRPTARRTTSPPGFPPTRARSPS